MAASNILLGAVQPQGLGAVGKAMNASSMLLGLGGAGNDLQDQLARQIEERRKKIIGNTPDRFGAVQSLLG